jgi:hypothetical protein
MFAYLMSVAALTLIGCVMETLYDWQAGRSRYFT